MTACVCLAILTVFLLANNKRHLRSVMAYYGVAHWLQPQADIKKARMPVAKPQTKTTPAPVKLPARILVSPDLNTVSSFIRELRLSGPKLCEALSKIDGFPEGGRWSVDPFDAQRFECQMLADSGTSGGDPTSLFIDIKGNAEGAIKSARMKFKTASGALDPTIQVALAKAFDVLIAQTRWPDFARGNSFLAPPKPFQLEAFGASISLQQERFDPESFNLFLRESATGAEQKRTRLFFNHPVLPRP